MEATLNKPQMTAWNRPPGYYKDSTYTIVSSVAFLIGIEKRIFENEHEPPKIDVFQKLENHRGARIIRNLCRLRTAIERNFTAIKNLMNFDYKSLATMPELVPVECIDGLLADGISMVKSNYKLNQSIIDINRLITDRINNCQELFPIWLNWLYLRELFIMPNGFTEDGIKEAARIYAAQKNQYPYQVYINWKPADEGNILYSDKKFVTLLYEWHGDVFTDISKVTDAGRLTKGSIYDFLDASRKAVVVVDCENSDPYKLCATLKNLDADALGKIKKIILYDDIHTAPAWRMLDSYTSVPVEHILIERVKQSKSLVDISLTAGACKEFYQNNADSFVIVSSDSDYWGLISALPSARFLVMVKYEKCGPDMKNALLSSGIFYCYIDDFCTGNSNDIKISALLKEIHRYLDRAFRLNVNTMLDEVYRTTRVSLSDAEQQQFYHKYVKPMHIVIDKDGNASIELRVK